MVGLDHKIKKILKGVFHKDIEGMGTLKEIIKNYPFFQFPYYIIAKKFQDKVKDKNKIIEIASIYATDRIQLKKFLSLEEENLFFHGFVESIDMDDDSVFSDDVISESLAEIMESQEKYSLASKIYERLILKLPEKKPLLKKKIVELKKKL